VVHTIGPNKKMCTRRGIGIDACLDLKAAARTKKQTRRDYLSAQAEDAQKPRLNKSKATVGRFTCWTWQQAPPPWSEASPHAGNSYGQFASTAKNRYRSGHHLNLGDVANHVESGLGQIIVVTCKNAVSTWT
jgi:hypothetical protein